MVRLLIALSFGVAALVLPARAEITKLMKMCNADGKSYLCPVFIPSMKAPDGWVFEPNRSKQLNVLMFLPKGATFANAPALIYTDARLMTDETNLARWVASSDAKWKAEAPGALVADEPAGDLGAGKRNVILHRYENKALKGQAFEYIAHFVEKDLGGSSYVVRLVVSGLDQNSVSAARPAFDAMLKNY